MDLADALVAKHPFSCPAPDFPLPDELSSVNLETERLLQHKQSSDRKGFGYFAREEIPQGTVLMVAKPLGMAMDWEEDEHDDQKYDTDDERGDEEPIEDDDIISEPILNKVILVRLLQKMQKNPALWSATLSEFFPRTKSDLSELPKASLACDNTQLQAEIEASLDALKVHEQLKRAVDDIDRSRAIYFAHHENFLLASVEHVDDIAVFEHEILSSVRKVVQR